VQYVDKNILRLCIDMAPISNGSLRNVQGGDRANRVTQDHARTRILTVNLILTNPIINYNI